MKKLLISLIGAASAMLMATAAETQRGVTEGFEGRAGAEDNAFDPSKDDLNGDAGPLLWARDLNSDGTKAEGESTVEQYTETTETYGSHYLKVDESNAIRRKFANVDNTDADTITLANSGEGIYVNTRVQFTASEDDVTPDDADKLIVWLKETVADEAAGTVAATNLIITATDATDVNSNERIDYVVNNVKVVPGQWYDLKITATRGENEFVPVFTVSLNGTQLTSASKADGETITAVDKFGSLLARDGKERMKFTSIGFKGNGAIDNVEMGTVVTEAPKNYEVGGVPYENFADALAAAQNVYAADGTNATVKLLKDYKLGDGTIEIGGNPVTIDLNGKTITSAASTIVAMTDVTIIDSVGGGKVETTGVSDETNTYYSILANDEDPVATITVGTSTANANITFVGTTYGAINVYGGKYTDVSGTFKSMVAGYEMSKNKDADGYYQLEPTGGTVTYRTLTLPTVANATAKVTKSDGSEVSNLSAIEDGTTVTVTWTANEGYEITAGGSVQIIMNADKEATAPTVVATYPTYFPEGATKDTKDKFDAWVTNKADGKRYTGSAYMDAYLLNVAPGAATIEEEKANFKVTAITVDAKGKVTVTTTTTNLNGDDYNGKVVVKGKASLSPTGLDWAEKDDTVHKFFKAFLVVE